MRSRATTRRRSRCCCRSSPIRRACASISISSSITPTTLRATSRCRNRRSGATLVAAWSAALERLAADPQARAARPPDRADRAGRAREARCAEGARPGGAAEADPRRGRARGSRHARSVLAPGGDQRGGGSSDRRRPVRGVRHAAPGGARALAFAVLFHAGPRRQREEARRQGRGGRLGRKGLRRGAGSRDATAVGRALRGAAGRADAAGRRAHREGRGAGDRRARARARNVLRAQPARARARRQEPREMERGATRHRPRRAAACAPTWRACARSCRPPIPRARPAIRCCNRRRGEARDAGPAHALRRSQRAGRKARRLLDVAAHRASIATAAATPAPRTSDCTSSACR